MSKLTGKALAERARELNIPGRSAMTASELREAIAAATGFDGEVTEPVTATDPEPEEKEVEVWHTVPNRAAKRRHARSLKLNSRGQRKGGHVTPPGSEARFTASVVAGERGKFYGTRKLDSFRVKTRLSDDDIAAANGFTPRAVAVNVIHEGH